MSKSVVKASTARKAIVLSDALMKVAEVGGTIHGGVKALDDFKAQALKALKACKVKDQNAIRDAFKLGYAAHQLYARVDAASIAKLQRPAVWDSKPGKLAWGAGGTAFSRLLKSANIPSADARGRKRGAKRTKEATPAPAAPTQSQIREFAERENLVPKKEGWKTAAEADAFWLMQSKMHSTIAKKNAKVIRSSLKTIIAEYTAKMAADIEAARAEAEAK